MSQVAVTGNGAGTGVFTLTSPNSNTNRTLTLPDNTGTLLSNKSAGAVLQIVQVAKTDSFSTTSASYVDVTGLSVSITPSSTSSKILVLGMIGLGGPSGGVVHGKMLVNGSDLLVGDASGSRVQANFSKNDTSIESDAPSCAFTYLHSPASVSAQTYKVQIVSPAGATVGINRTGYDGNNAYYSRFASTIILMEIAG